MRLKSHSAGLKMPSTGLPSSLLTLAHVSVRSRARQPQPLFMPVAPSAVWATGGPLNSHIFN